MPRVDVIHSGKAVGADLDQVKRQLSAKLPHVVANAFDIPQNKDARVTPKDIIVHHRVSDPADTNTKDIEVYILTEGFPGRMLKIREDGGDEILHILAVVADPLGLTGFVWILPHQGTWFKAL